LSDTPGIGLSCEENGLFLGEIPLLERIRNEGGRDRWQPRSTSTLNKELSQRFGLPIECKGKIGRLDLIARALDSDDLFRAKIAALHLQIPDPPDLEKVQTSTQTSELARIPIRLKKTRCAQHAGGEFAPVSTGPG
jgi:hypothetical protein